MILHLDDLPIELTYKSVQNINLRINRQGKVKVSAPFSCGEVDVLQFLQTKRKWIYRHRHRILSHPEPHGLHYKAGETHYFLGQSYVLLYSFAGAKKGWKEEGLN